MGKKSERRERRIVAAMARDAARVQEEHLLWKETHSKALAAADLRKPSGEGEIRFTRSPTAPPSMAPSRRIGTAKLLMLSALLGGLELPDPPEEP